MKKKLVLLGGSRYLLPVIEAAHKLDCHVITMDYLPSNIAHRYSDQYLNVSIVDKDAVLEACRAEKVDGIMSFAADPGVVAAAYTAEQLALPFQCSYSAAQILQDKGRFRAFLDKNGFNCPHAKSYKSPQEPFSELDYFNWPVIVKPVDSAGSKGVTRVDDPAQLAQAIDIAVSQSLNGSFIIEDFLEFKGHHSSTDPFSVNGELKFATYSDQLFDSEADNPYTPAQIIWPSSMAEDDQNYLTGEIGRLITLLDMQTGIYNIETCVSVAGLPYLMEVSPRGGGCKIAEIQKLAFGIDLIDAEVRKAVGLPVENVYQTSCDGVWCEAVIHAEPGRSGKLQSVTFDSVVKEKYLKTVDLQLMPGEMVHPFTGANMAIGDMFLRFDSREELDDVMGNMRQWLRIDLED